MEYNLTKNLNNDLETEPNYITDKKFKLKMKYNIKRRKHLKYNDVLDSEIDKIIDTNNIDNNYNETRNKEKEIVFKKLEINKNIEIKNIIYEKKLNNNIYLHLTDKCILYLNEEQYDFDYIKCINKSCNIFYCEYCFVNNMEVKKNEYQFELYNTINRYIFKYPYINIYKCYQCNYNIPIVSDIKKCNNCNITFIKKITNIKNNKCYYCNNYLCNNCINKSCENIYDKFWCSNC